LSIYNLTHKYSQKYKQKNIALNGNLNGNFEETNIFGEKIISCKQFPTL
jgi:hypothetical protein